MKKKKLVESKEIYSWYLVYELKQKHEIIWIYCKQINVCVIYYKFICKDFFYYYFIATETVIFWNDQSNWAFVYINKQHFVENDYVIENELVMCLIGSKYYSIGCWLQSLLKPKTDDWFRYEIKNVLASIVFRPLSLRWDTGSGHSMLWHETEGP